MESAPTRNQYEKSAALYADIVIVGAGFAGCLAAILLGRLGHKVIVVDIVSTNTTLFRAEKISGDQLNLLRDVGLLDDLKAVSTPVKQFINIRGKHIVDRVDVEEYGMVYSAMVNALRQRLPSNVTLKRGRVLDIHTTSDLQSIVLSDGETISTRLAVIATGYGDALHRKLGFERRPMRKESTLCIGFTLKPPISGFRFPALAAYGERCGDAVDYLSLFPLGDTMRGNLFLFADVRDPRVGALRARGMASLLDMMPGVRPWLEGCEWMGDIAVFPVELYKYSNVVRDGIVLIGDAYKTSCPAVGTGLSCALIDVLSLRDHVIQWLKTPGMEAAKIAAFYADPGKAAFDAQTDRQAAERRTSILRTSPLHRLRLTAHFIKRGLLYRLRKNNVRLSFGTAQLNESV